ncbi:MAG: trigger factor [Miltoncostaeaceae bacterium]|nr:trigger factor [Miltoncostaeaceae bacterium]
MPVITEVVPLEENRVRLDVAVPEDEVRKRVERAIRKIGREIRVPGFRPGKIPAQVVLNRVGRETVMQEMLRDSIGEWYAEAVADAGVDPIDEPDLDLPDETTEAEFSFKATVQLRPKAKLGTYRGLEVVREEETVPEGALQAELERLRAEVAKLEPVERPAAAGDFLTIDFDGRIGGRPVLNANARDYLVELGGRRLVAGFDEQLEGMSAGETKTMEIAYPQEDQRTELAGQTVEYTVSVKRVHARVLPELDDAFAQQASGHETLEELVAEIQRRLEEAVRARVDEAFRRAAVDAAAAGATLEVPKVMVERRVSEILHETAHRLPEGMSLEDYIRSTGRTPEQLIEELSPSAEAALRREMVVEAIAEAEGLSADDAEVEAQVRRDAEATERDPEKLLQDLRAGGGFEAVRRDMVIGKAIELLAEAATPITAEQAKAKDKLWTPKAQEPAVEAPKIWTPDQPPPK